LLKERLQGLWYRTVLFFGGETIALPTLSLARLQDNGFLPVHKKLQILATYCFMEFVSLTVCEAFQIFIFSICLS
jgi:hypothetical protein